ncbi:hypothetical protein HIM_01638 [Hirsutella minnesotensis 3608]|nr:hypothetical protein HIM_01638 [Hirsutella minnesotensis 3608]
MAAPVARTLFKKKEGILTLSSDSQHVTWTLSSGGPPTVSFPVANITNLQQTPDTAAKVVLKIFEKPTEGSETTTYLFTFNSSDARAEAKSIKDILSQFLVDARGGDGGITKLSTGTPSAANASTPGTNGSASASMTFASAVNSQASSARWYDDNQLKSNIELQQSLMKKDTSLYQTYMEAMSMKPDSLSGASFNSQFWSTRTNLLRAHAIEINQKKGAYNVLSTVKPRTVDGELKLNISVEQVQMILSQHPLVKRIYNENVPKLSEADFWSRFFLSRLSRQLRGERVTDNDRPDPLFDKYDANENTQGFQSRIMAQNIPHIIDLEGNEENQGGFKGGNAKDVEMRPRTNMPIVKTLNSLSEKIMANVAPSDGNIEDGQGSHDTYNELLLRDLRGDAKENRIMLNVKEQNKFFSKKDAAPSDNARTFAKQNPADVLAKMRATFGNLSSNGTQGTALQAAIDFEDDSDSDDESQKGIRVGSRTAIKAAEKEVMTGVLQQRSQKYGHSDDATSPMGLPSHMVEKCALTHATSVEFLHQFWNAFLSGDPDRAPELQYLAESLQRSGSRIAAVADEAEAERTATIRQRKQEIRDHFERTGKKIRWKSDMVGGGRDAVVKMMQPLLDALEKAQTDYKRALAAEGIHVSTEQ